MTTETFVPPSPSTATARKASLAAFVGGIIEYYDFFIYASSAALVFGVLFFPGDGVTGVLLSLATLGIAYVARPLGAIVLGHLGDKIGRRRTLILTIGLMGGATVLIGCLPTYSQVGIWAPVLLVLLRLIQGFSAGGESAGASALTLESSPTHRRGFYGSFVQIGIGVGIMLATLVMIPVQSLPREELLAWGWRLPFWGSVVLLAVGMVVRRRLEEPAIFVELKKEEEVTKFPLATLFRTQWREIVRLFFCTFIQSTFTWFAVFGLSFAAGVMKVPATTTLWILMAAYVTQLFAYVFGGYLSDRIGRKPVIIATAIGNAIGITFFFFAVTTANVPLILAAAVLLAALGFGGGATPAFFAEMFHAKVRYSGSAIGVQLAQVAIGFVPLVGSLILAGNPANWTYVAAAAAGMALIAAVAAMTSKETYRTPLEELGHKTAETDKTAESVAPGTWGTR